MKQIRSFLNGLLACGLVFAMAATATAQTKDYGATVTKVAGSARFTVDGGASWNPLTVGAVLKAGSMIQTSKTPGSYVDLVLGEGTGAILKPGLSYSGPGLHAGGSYQRPTTQNAVRIMENSMMGIDKLSMTGVGTGEAITETQLDLKSGRIIGNVKKMSSASKYEVKLPTGVAGIRGTIYDITADGLVRVAEGSVVIAYMEGDIAKTIVISAGQAFNSLAPSGPILVVSPNEMAAIVDAAQAAGASPPPAVITTTIGANQTTTFFISNTAGSGSP